MFGKLGISRQAYMRIESEKWIEHERDMYKVKSEEDEKLIESLNAHIKTLQMIVNSRTRRRVRRFVLFKRMGIFQEKARGLKKRPLSLSLEKHIYKFALF